MTYGKYRVCVVGLGYVGLPLALFAASRGHKVYGYDINQEHVAVLRSGNSPYKDEEIGRQVKKFHELITFTCLEEAIQKVDVVIVCVPTPVDNNCKPNLNPLISACQTIARNTQEGQLVVIESTVFPGTIEEIVWPIFEGTMKVGENFFLAHCPERIDPGNKVYTLPTLPRVLGGMTEKCADKAYQFYTSLIDAPITRLSCIKAAETTKVVENIFRDVNIALVNELAKSFDVMGIDTVEVIKAASTKPFAFMPHYPGCGVGGHCIPVDPYYLIEKSREQGFNPRILALARDINEGMPHYTIQKMKDALGKAGIKLAEANVILLGLSYKKDIDDVRESPALVLADLLTEEKIRFETYDPYVLHKSSVKDLDLALLNKNCLIIATNHSVFDSIGAERLRRNGIKVVIDGRNCLDKDELVAKGIIYRGIGR